MGTKTLTQPVLLPVLTDDVADTYVGEEAEMFVDGRGEKPVLLLSDGQEAGGIPLKAEEGTLSGGVATPTIVNPSENESVINGFVINTDAFVGYKADGSLDAHATTWWQIASDENFDTLLVEREEDAENLTQLDLSALGIELPLGPIWIRCIFKGQSGVFSYWSASTLVEVAIPNPDTLITTLNGYDNDGWNFGQNMAISDDGKTFVIADHNSDNGGTRRGVVYIYEETNDGYAKTTLIPPYYDDYDEFGSEIALSGDGQHCFIEWENVNILKYSKINGTWTQIDSIAVAERGIWQIKTNFDGTRIACVDANVTPEGRSNVTGQIIVCDYNGSSWDKTILVSDKLLTVTQWGSGYALSADGDTVVVYEDRFFDSNDNRQHWVDIFNFDESGGWIIEPVRINTSLTGSAGATAISQDKNRIFIGPGSNDGVSIVMDKIDGSWTYKEIRAISANIDWYMGSQVCMSPDAKTVYLNTQDKDEHRVLVWREDDAGVWSIDLVNYLYNNVSDDDVIFGIRIALSGNGQVLLVAEVTRYSGHGRDFDKGRVYVFK